MKTGWIPVTGFALAAALLIAGCPSEGDTITYYQANLGYGDFPGGTIEENNLASDGRAFTENSADLEDMTVFTNWSNGTAMILHHSTDFFGSGDHQLWASFFDGSSFTPPVEIHAPGCDVSADFELKRAFVVWLNTEGNTADQGRSRNGDAVIVFRRQERDTTGTSDLRLYNTYFDRSRSHLGVDPDNDDVHWGFDTTAAYLDTDSNDDVAVFGAVSDSWYSEFFGPAFQRGPMFMEPWSGENTTYLGVFWTKDNGAGGQSLYTANFDLDDANTANEFDSESAFTTATTMDVDDQFSDGFWVHDGWLLYIVDLDNEVSDPNHELLECTRWDAGTGELASPLVLSRVDPDNAVTAEMTEWVYGEDHGLGRLYVIWKEEGFVSTTTGSGVHPDKDVMLAVVDPAGPSVEQDEIDNYVGTDTGDPFDVDNIIAAISRDGSWIGVGWRQGYSTAEPTTCLFMQAIQTVPEGGAARTLADSILASPVRMNDDYQENTDIPNVVDWEMQDMMKYSVGFQSDLTRMNVLFVQKPDSADYENFQLRTAFLDVELGANATTAPTLSTGAGSDSDTKIWENDDDHPFWSVGSDVLENAVALDAGGGAVYVYFIGDGDGNPLVESPGDPHEARLFVWDGVSATEISGDAADTGESTLGFSNSRQVIEFQTTTTPWKAGTDAHAPSHHHLFIVEERSAPGSSEALRYREVDVDGSAGASFWPALTEQPADLDTGEASNVELLLQDGPPLLRKNTVAVFFSQGGHLYYNERTVGGTWYEQNGLPHPEIVDNLSMHSIVAPEAGFYKTPSVFPETGPIDMLSKTMFFFGKQCDDMENVRLFVRVRN